MLLDGCWMDKKIRSKIKIVFQNHTYCQVYFENGVTRVFVVVIIHVILHIHISTGVYVCQLTCTWLPVPGYHNICD